MASVRKEPLTKQEANALFRRYLAFGCPGSDALYLQGKSWPWWLAPFYKKYYDTDGQRENLLRHFTWYNTEPIAGSLIFGIVLGMEERKAIYEDVDPEAITAIKSSLMGPVAGIGDSLIQATLIPLLCTLCIGISGNSGSPLGPILYVVLLLACVFSFGYVLFDRGYKLGKESLDLFGNAGLQDITKAVGVFGLIVIGCLANTRCKGALAITFMNGDTETSLNATLNSIFPNLLNFGLVLLYWYLMKKKKVKMQTLFYVTMAVVIVLSFLGIV